MSPEGWTLTLFTGGMALLTGNFAIGIVSILIGVGVGAIHYWIHTKDHRLDAATAEALLAQEGHTIAEKQELKRILAEAQAQIKTQKWASGCIGAAAFICPLAGIAYLVFDWWFTDRAATRHRAHMNKIYPAIPKPTAPVRA
jgi:hypothetical protein